MYAVNHELARRRVEITVKEHMKDRWQMNAPCEHNRGENSGEKTTYFLNAFGDLKLLCAHNGIKGRAIWENVSFYNRRNVLFPAD